MDHYDRGHTQLRHQFHQNKDEELASNAALLANSSLRSISDESDAFTEVIIDMTDIPTTQVPHAMDKVALDLYAFLQQGRSNLVDFVKETEDPSDSTDSSGDSLTTEVPDTTFSGTDPDDAVGATTSAPATTMPASTTSSTTTTTTTAAPQTIFEEPSTVAPGRTKFRRPGISGPAISRNRFKSHGGISSSAAISTEVSPTETASPTQRSRGRFGVNSASGTGGGSFKRVRTSLHKSASQPTAVSLEESTLQKDAAEKVSAETKPLNGRGRYRSGSARSGPQARTTVAPSGDKQNTSIPSKVTNPGGPAPHRTSNFNKLGSVNRRRGNKPTIPVSGAATTEEGNMFSLIRC